jgi:hypothetical protein
MITTKTFVEDDTQVSVWKIDIITEESDCLVGLRLMDKNGVTEVHIDADTKEPVYTHKRLKFLSDEDRNQIFKDGYKNAFSPWTDEVDQQLMQLHKALNGNEREIARLMQRTDRAIHLRLKALEIGTTKTRTKKHQHVKTRFQQLGDITHSYLERSPSRRRRRPRTR